MPVEIDGEVYLGVGDIPKSKSKKGGRPAKTIIGLAARAVGSTARPGPLIPLGCAVELAQNLSSEPDARLHTGLVGDARERFLEAVRQATTQPDSSNRQH